MMGGKVYRTEEDKYRQSLKSWGDDFDNRPFIRVKEDKEKDRHDYERKWKRINEELSEVARKTGDHIENINLIDPWGHICSKGGSVRDFETFL